MAEVNYADIVEQRVAMRVAEQAEKRQKAQREVEQDKARRTATISELVRAARQVHIRFSGSDRGIEMYEWGGGVQYKLHSTDRETSKFKHALYIETCDDGRVSIVVQDADFRVLHEAVGMTEALLPLLVDGLVDMCVPDDVQ